MCGMVILADALLTYGHAAHKSSSDAEWHVMAPSSLFIDALLASAIVRAHDLCLLRRAEMRTLKGGRVVHQAPAESSLWQLAALDPVLSFKNKTYISTLWK